MRDEMFWWELGNIGGQRLHIIMDVDGINQEMHSFYRQDVNLEKVLANLEAVAETTCKLTVLTVLFKHNQDYLEEIRDMCRKLGVERFDEVEGNNFGPSPIYEFEDMDGNIQELHQITREDREQGLKRYDRRVRDHRHSDNKSTKKEEYDNIDNWRGYDEIDCLALAQHNLKVSVRGTITPCCYLSSGVETTAVYKSEKYPYQHLTTTGQQKDGPHPVMQNMLDRIGDFQLGKGKSIFELLSDPWWEKYLPESWEDRDTPIFGCAKICGKKSCMATTELEIHASLQE
jgi:sulfatase maturation enzyme AslB (radical SAM superfamily)